MVQGLGEGGPLNESDYPTGNNIGPQVSRVNPRDIAVRTGPPPVRDDGSPRPRPCPMNIQDDKAPEKLFTPLKALSNRSLSKQDWTTWCSLLDRWTDGFANWSIQRANLKAPTPQSAWARRQQELRAQGRQKNPAQGPSPNRNRAIGRKVALQKEYRLHPKLCMAQLRKSPPPTKCSVSIATVRDYFVAKQADERGNTPVGSPPLQLWANPTPSDVMVSPITEEELSKTLKRMKANSAPGPDRLRYSAWKQLNPATITTILNTCRINGRIPSRWKQSNTILIHKGNDPNNLDNWRPIALQNTLYKLYAGIVARRVSDWALANKIISSSQKGFLPFEGCLEHSFVLKSIFQDSRRRKKPASVVWLDLRDAFGSVPHPILLKILNLAGLHGATLTIIRDIYLGSTTSVQTRSERTPQIPCLRGVKQGCPLSPILFDLVMEVVIRAMEGVPGSGYQLADTTIKTRTYADDLCAVASSTDIIQRMLAKAQEAAKWAGLKFNPQKCATLTIHRGSKLRQRAVPTRPTLEGEQIPALAWEDRYKYLGCKVGADPKSDLKQVKESYLKDCDTIMRSDLADWQKLDAMHRFARPQLIYTLQNMDPPISWAKSIDQATKSLCKMHLKLPRRSTTPFLYSPTRAGGLGLPNIEDELHITRTTTAFKLLFNQGDARTKTIATSALAKNIKTRSLDQRSPQDFLNHRADRGEGQRGDIKTIWSKVRSSLKHCEAELSTTTESISCCGRSLSWGKRNLVASLLRSAIQSRYLRRWNESPDQGRSVTCFSQHPASNHWVPSGKYTSFGEYRFALKARLNLLPTRTVRKRAGENVTDLSCPRCNNEQETLAHVLNHCPSQVGLIRQRHNNILTRLANAIPPWKGRQYKEQMVPGDPQGLKPDLVVLNDVSKEAYVVDVTMPFEGSGSFAMARTEKEEKYNHLKALLSSKGYNKVEVDAFVVGPLGSWDKLNEMVLRKLSVPRKYATLFRRLCCTEAIKGSFIMWKNHTMGPSRYPDDSQQSLEPRGNTKSPINPSEL